MQPGQLVTCVGNDLLYFKLLLLYPSVCPKKGLVYTVQNVTTNCPSCGEDHVTVEEIASPFVTGYPARWFKPCREADFGLFMKRVMGTSMEQGVRP